MIVARILCKNHAELWTLAANCRPFLGPADALFLLAEDAVTSTLEPWDGRPAGAWTQGRVFGAQGELRWRAYGPLVRGLLVTDGPANAEPAVAVGHLRELGFAEVQAPELTSADRTLFLWRTDDYVTAQVRRYVDDVGTEHWVRYRGVTREK